MTTVATGRCTGQPPGHRRQEAGTSCDYQHITIVAAYDNVEVGMDRRTETIEDRVTRLENVLDATVKQVHWLTGALFDLTTSLEEEVAQESAAQSGIIVPMRRN